MNFMLESVTMGLDGFLAAIGTFSTLYILLVYDSVHIRGMEGAPS